MSETYYLASSGEWKTKERIVLDAIDTVCGACGYTPDDISGVDPCEGCPVVETARRIYEMEEE